MEFSITIALLNLTSSPNTRRNYVIVIIQIVIMEWIVIVISRIDFCILPYIPI